MDLQNLLTNDDGEDDIALGIEEDVANLKIDGISDLGLQLSSSRVDTYSCNSVLKGSYTLRECNLLYGASNGCKYTGSDVAEFDRCITKGCISPLRRFTNQIGHFVEIDSEITTDKHSIVCFKPEVVDSLIQFKDSIKESLDPSIRRGKLWNISGCKQYIQSSSGTWRTTKEELNSKTSSALSILAASFPAPLSAHTQHAWFETQDSRDIITTLKVFVQPEETTAGPGLFGTLHNNQQIDLAQEQNSKDIDIEARYADLDIPGFLCAGHTSHSTEAGRVRRVCCNVSVRVLNNSLLNKLYKACEVANRYNNKQKQWILFCMGKMVYCSNEALISLRNFLISSASGDINTATLHINNEMHTAILSISSGVLLRRDANDIPITTISLYSDDWSDGKYNIQLPEIDTELGLEFYYSGFFRLIPGIEFDRPPRSLISSVQSIQAVTAPYGAGTSSVAPCHLSKPLVTTPLAEALLTSPDSKLADMIPGEDLIIAFANFNDTNEDSIMISLDVAERGLFSHMAYSKNLIGGTEAVPSVGEYVNIYDNKWWKVYSRYQKYAPQPIDLSGKDTPMVPFKAGGDGRGKVVSKSLTDTGQMSVKVLRYSTPVSGDKLATGHGQKGVIKWIKGQDMPWGIDERGQPIKFDIIISLSSIVNRLTVGQYYEMILGAKAAREGKRIIVSPGEYVKDHNETVLYDGETGELIERTSKDGDIPILASWGISRVWQMTQLTWDKQHYTHNTEGKYTTTTRTGRTAGGGLRFGEMETHAIDSSGLTAVGEELKRRVDCIDTYFCMKCDMLAQHHPCGSDKHFVPISIPYSLLVLAHANRLTSGYIMKFKVSPS